MDKETLLELKQYANAMSDLSSKTFLYRKICDELKTALPDLKYYQCVVNTQNDSTILKTELQELINEVKQSGRFG